MVYNGPVQVHVPAEIHLAVAMPFVDGFLGTPQYGGQLEVQLGEVLPFLQEIPFIGHSKLKLFAEIENFTNLLNKNWGQVREYAFPYAIAPVQVSCLTSAVPTGTAPGAAAAANAGQACVQYRYTSNQTAVVNGVTQFNDPTDTIYPNQSLYAVRIGVRFSF